MTRSCHLKKTSAKTRGNFKIQYLSFALSKGKKNYDKTFNYFNYSSFRSKKKKQMGVKIPMSWQVFTTIRGL
jgi:hypothetical protein